MHDSPLARRKDTEPAHKVQPVRCWNGEFGCSKLFPIDKNITREFNWSVLMCIECCNRIASQWGCKFDELGFLMTAIQNSRAGRCGVLATKDEVWQIMEKFGFKRKASYSNQQRTAADFQLPTADRNGVGV